MFAFRLDICAVVEIIKKIVDTSLNGLHTQILNDNTD